MVKAAKNYGRACSTTGRVRHLAAYLIAGTVPAEGTTCTDAP